MKLPSVFVYLCFGVFVNGFKISKNYNEKQSKDSLCAELVTFTPNLCQHSAALQYCFKECDVHHKYMLRCGKRSHIRGRTKRIVGGSLSEHGSWPWHVSLRINRTQWCSGSILSEHFVLTAAHCFDDFFTSENPKDWMVHAGDFSLNNTEHSEQKIQVQKIMMHPKASNSYYGIYGKEKSWVVVHNDIAILQLSSPIQLEDLDKTHLCLPDDNIPIPDLYPCNIVGWGHMSHDGVQSDELREARVYIVPNKICNLPFVYNHTIPIDEFRCAGYEEGGIDACNYDSGGAMICEKNGHWYATGIVSSGYECARPHSYGLYTNIKNYKSWIIDTILTKADPIRQSERRTTHVLVT